MQASPTNERIAAGDFATWLIEIRASLRGDSGTHVPCGDCVGCCVSSYFIPIRPQDALARSRIPKDLLVSAPGQASGHQMMGYRADGTCPMLVAGQCTIYEARPQTCRDYDCRIFAAAGIAAGDADKAVINQRVAKWQFSYASDGDRATHSAIRQAATFIRQNAEHFPGGRAPTAPTGIAVLAIKAYAVFQRHDIESLSAAETAFAMVDASRRFDRSLTNS